MASLDCRGHSLPVGLQSSSHCDANLGELRCKRGTGVVAVQVKIIALVMELLYQCNKYTGCLAKIFSVDQLCLSPIINVCTLQVPRLTLTQHVCLDAPRVRFTLQVLPEGDTTFEGDHQLVYSYVSVGCVCCAGMIYEGLDLPLLSSAVWVTNVQGSKDLKEAIPGKDGPEE